MNDDCFRNSELFGLIYDLEEEISDCDDRDPMKVVYKKHLKEANQILSERTGNNG